MVGRTEGTITSWYAIIDEGAELWEVYSNGHEVLRAVFKNNKFQAIKQMKRIKPTGIYGYLGRHLLRMASKSGTYIYYTENKDLIEEYKFKAIREPLLKNIFYELEAPRNTGIRAFKIRSFAKYQGFDLYIENCDDKMLLVAPLNEDSFLKVYPRRIWHKGWYDSRDSRFEISKEEVTDVWEERTPIEGFKFDVEPIVYIKKDGVWLKEL